MRASLAFPLSALATVAVAAPMPIDSAPSPTPAPHCRRVSSYVAGAGSLYRGEPLKPRKLTDLPPGTTYMAVDRHIDGCEAPLTMTEYRNPRRR